MATIGEWTAEWAKNELLNVSYFAEMGSTNDHAKERDHSGPGGKMHVTLTDHQTAGRGRGSNQWEDAHGKSLLSSWSVNVTSAPQPTLSPRIGLALHRAVLEIWPSLPFSLKAPNDLFIGNKKIAGLLIEVVSRGDENTLIVGLGFNITAHPGVAMATDLKTQLTRTLSRAAERSITQAEWSQFLSAWLRELNRVVSSIAQKDLTSAEISELKIALNKNPLVAADPIHEITPQGTLKTATRTVEWSAL